jgi:hypothetical protein
MGAIWVEARPMFEHRDPYIAPRTIMPSATVKFAGRLKTTRQRAQQPYARGTESAEQKSECADRGDGDPKPTKSGRAYDHSCHDRGADCVGGADKRPSQLRKYKETSTPPAHLALPSGKARDLSLTNADRSAKRRQTDNRNRRPLFAAESNSALAPPTRTA